MSVARWSLHKRGRSISTLAAIVGLLATAAGVQATAASWSDSVSFTAAVRPATPPTTTAPRPETDPVVSVTAVCKGPTTYTVLVQNDSPMVLVFNFQVGANVISGPHTVAGGEARSFEIPNGTNGVKVTPIGDWRNGYKRPVTTPKNDCPPSDIAANASATSTTSRPATTTTTTTKSPTPRTDPAPPTVSSGGISAGNVATIITAIDWDITNARETCAVVTITGADATPQDWAVRLDLSVPPWNGSSAEQIDLDRTGTVSAGTDGGALITGRSDPGASGTNNTPITSAQTAAITICNAATPVPPPADPSWYTVTTTQTEWTDTEACIFVTVATTRTDFAENPFFYGWATTVDLTAAKAHITGAGRTVDVVEWQPSPDGAGSYSATPASYQPPLDSYTITSGYDFALRPAGGGADWNTATVCVNGS